MKRLGILLLLAACSSEPPAPPDLAGDWFAAWEWDCGARGPLEVSQSGATITGTWTWRASCTFAGDTSDVLEIAGTIVGDSVRFTSEAGGWTAGIVSADELVYVASGTGFVWRATR